MNLNCKNPDCPQTSSAHCDQCDHGNIVMVSFPDTFMLEQPTPMLRWNGGILEQAFTRTIPTGTELVWRAVPSI